jgi:hypothetical protein
MGTEKYKIFFKYFEVRIYSKQIQILPGWVYYAQIYKRDTYAMFKIQVTVSDLTGVWSHSFVLS